MAIWNSLLQALGEVLRFFHDITVGLFGGYSWAVAIVLLTLLVRLALMPLAIKQFRSMQAMQKLRPQMKKIQTKYKTDRSMMRTDPEKYREKRQKQQEELMALYKEHNVNPASSCLPLIAQMPIFIALFSVLRSPDVIPELVNAPFPIGATLQMPANQAGIIALGLLLLMGVTTFIQQKQMMGRQVAMADDQQMQQQKLMMYIMPVFLVFLGFNLPVGVLVYWVTTNLLQMAQQWYMLREVDESAEQAREANKSGPAERASGREKKEKKKGDTAGKGGRSGGKRDESKGGRSGGKRDESKGGRSGGKRDESKGRQNGAGGNGHKPGGPGPMGKQGDETRDKRR
jgi:YidC/Oxa1 family membrane protein insertase